MTDFFVSHSRQSKYFLNLNQSLRFIVLFTSSLVSLDVHRKFLILSPGLIRFRKELR